MLHPDEHHGLWGIAAALACLVLGSVVPYARARAESVGATAQVGIAERADRLLLALVPFTFMQVGLPVVVLEVVLDAAGAREPRHRVPAHGHGAGAARPRAGQEA